MSDQTRALVDDSGPLLDGQAQTSDSIKIWARNFAGITDSLHANDPQIRNILQTGPGAVSEVSALLNQVKPTLPVLLANLNTVGQVLVTYNPGIEQLLVILPAYIAAQESFGLPKNNPTGLPLGEFATMFGDPPPCGRLPAAVAVALAGRPPDIDTPDGLYCKLPQDSPISVRGRAISRAWTSPASAHPRWRSARATCRMSRWRCASTPPGRTPGSQPDLAGHPRMTG